MNEEFKRASWLELFYDVAFVALVAQLTYLAAGHHHTPSDILSIFIIGYTIFIAWWSTTANRNLLPRETATDKVLIQLQMVGAFLMGIAMPEVFVGSHAIYFISFAVLRFVQTLMLLRMYHVYPETRPNTYNILEGFAIAGVLWLCAGLVAAPLYIVFALAALAIDILVPLTRGKGNTVRYLNVFHLQERLGLFLMLVIGESMIVVALSNTLLNHGVDPALIFSGLGIMIALWWLYFEHSDFYSGVRPRNLFMFLHSHGMLFGSIIFVSVGYKLVIEEIASVSGLVFVALGIIGATGALTFIRIAHHGMSRVAMLKIFILTLPYALITWFGIETGMVREAIVLYTIWYLVVAFIDYKNCFTTLEATRTNESS